MDVVRHRDARHFRDRLNSWLSDREARNNLILGITGNIASHPDIFDEHRLWTVESGGAMQAAALITPPRKLVTADAESADAIAALARAVRDDLGGLPGVVANQPTVGWFVEAWTTLTGAEAGMSMSQRVFSLEAVTPVPRPRGKARPASFTEGDDLTAWMLAFQAEALPADEQDEDLARRAIALRLDDYPGTGMWVWDVQGHMRAMSGYGGATNNGIRIGPVYTPPEHRGNGYATALVAEQSQWLIDQGRRSCFLYTHLSNPTSNAIYERIGYRQVAESAEYYFRDPRRA